MPGARQQVVFFLNGARCEATGDDAPRTVSEYLRERRGLIGTKIVCSEGDCGSCTMLVGRAEEGRLRYRPIDSCIQFVFQLDGAHVVTIEGLASGGVLNPVQQAMIDCHGSQCGFCTPGFVMAMTGVVDSTACGLSPPPDEQTWREALTGNLCRCTGYSQIIDAGELAAEGDWRSLDEQYPPKPIVTATEELASEPFDMTAGNGRRVYSPVDLEDALEFRSENPGCCVVAGATDLGVQRNKGRIEPRVYLDLTRIAKLQGLQIIDGESTCTLSIGSLANWTELLEFSRGELPEFAKILSVFGSPQIRHAGTLGGNVINASPIADSLPLLFVMQAKLELASAAGTRRVDIIDFYLDYKEFDLRGDELLTRIDLPLPESDDLLKLYKISRRRDLDISTFTAAIWMRLDGEMISEARLAYGAVGPTVLRLPETETYLVGKPFSAETMQSAGEVAIDEITPITDVRGAADYRYQLAKNVLLKFHAEYELELAVT